MNPIIDQYVAVKRQIEALEAELKDIKDAVIEALRAEGGKAEACGTTVTLVEQERRSFDIDTLRATVTPSTFRLITSPSVVTKALDAAITVGKVDPSVIAPAISTTKVESIRIK